VETRQHGHTYHSQRRGSYTQNRYASNVLLTAIAFFFSSRRRHTSWPRDWSSDVCSSDLRTSHGNPHRVRPAEAAARTDRAADLRSEEHTSELQSRGHLVCRLLLEKKNT